VAPLNGRARKTWAVCLEETGRFRGSDPQFGTENSMAASDNKKILAALEANWYAEIEGFHTYTAISKGEAAPPSRECTTWSRDGGEAQCRSLGRTHQGSHSKRSRCSAVFGSMYPALRKGIEPTFCNFLQIWTRSLALLAGRVKTRSSQGDSPMLDVISITLQCYESI
jgi:hypothetical protein